MVKYALCHILPIPIAYFESIEEAEDAVLKQFEEFPDSLKIDDIDEFYTFPVTI